MIYWDNKSSKYIKASNSNTNISQYGQQYGSFFFTVPFSYIIAATPENDILDGIIG